MVLCWSIFTGCMFIKHRIFNFWVCKCLLISLLLQFSSSYGNNVFIYWAMKLFMTNILSQIYLKNEKIAFYKIELQQRSLLNLLLARRILYQIYICADYVPKNLIYTICYLVSGECLEKFYGNANILIFINIETQTIFRFMLHIFIFFTLKKVLKIAIYRQIEGGQLRRQLQKIRMCCCFSNIPMGRLIIPFIHLFVYLQFIYLSAGVVE